FEWRISVKVSLEAPTGCQKSGGGLPVGDHDNTMTCQTPIKGLPNLTTPSHSGLPEMRDRPRLTALVCRAFRMTRSGFPSCRSLKVSARFRPLAILGIDQQVPGKLNRPKNGESPVQESNPYSQLTRRSYEGGSTSTVLLRG